MLLLDVAAVGFDNLAETAGDRLANVAQNLPPVGSGPRFGKRESNVQSSVRQISATDLFAILKRTMTPRTSLLGRMAARWRVRCQLVGQGLVSLVSLVSLRKLIFSHDIASALYLLVIDHLIRHLAL